MIEAHVGLPGAGKTLHAVARLLEAKREKRPTIANFHSRTGSWNFGLWADIAEAGNCLAVIDEAHMWFSARTWTKTQQLELAVFQQSRKEGLDLIWIAQHEARVDVAIREVTAFIWRHRMFGNYIVCSKVSPDEPKVVLGRKILRLSPDLHRHYFTEERIGTRDGEGYAMGGGDAYRRGAAAPLLGGDLRLMPNYYRVEGPNWVRWMRYDQLFLREEILRAVEEWARAGRPKSSDVCAIGFYRAADGTLQELTGGGEIVPREECFDLTRRVLGKLDRAASRLERVINPGHSNQTITWGARV